MPTQVSGGDTPAAHHRHRGLVKRAGRSPSGSAAAARHLTPRWDPATL